MVEFIIDEEEKKRISRAVLSSLQEWYGIPERVSPPGAGESPVAGMSEVCTGTRLSIYADLYPVHRE